jgi:thiol-disulfide isomerase/thioredoxin
MLLACLALPLAAQSTYQNASAPDDPICPQIDRDKMALHYGARSPGTTGGMVGADTTVLRHYQVGHHSIPQEERKSVAAFTAYDEQGKPTSVASLKGKVVLVGLWSGRCDPSAKMLMEFAALYPKHSAFGFELLAVNFDESKIIQGSRHGSDVRLEGGWRAINTFRTKNRQFLANVTLPFYTPGLGNEGASNFMDIVHSLPALFVVDRGGNLAQVHIGYADGFVGEAVKKALAEGYEAPAPVAPATAPK